MSDEHENDESIRQIIKDNRLLFMLLAIFVITIVSAIVIYALTHQPPKPIPAGYVVIR